MQDPLWTVVRYLLLRARARASAARAGRPESGAITLEWIVIAGILVVAAIAAGLVFTRDIKRYEAKIP
ncbi:MAG: hypothetical protein ABSA03_04430 [Streptosporangiaceae bacterium]|jgi:putative copper export protein